MHQIKPAF